MFLKYFFFIMTYIVVSQSFAQACRQEDDWACVFPEPTSYTAHNQDPFKERVCLADCEATLKKKYFSHTPENVKPFDIENEKVMRVGSFIVDHRLHLGYGDTANVYLALQPSTDILFAVKRMCSNSEKSFKEKGDYINLKKLDRLYGVYQQIKDQHTSLFCVFLPFGGLRDINGVASFLEDKSMFENLKTREGLVDALLDELSFLASRGVRHLDQSSNHYMGGLHYKHVMAIDLNSIHFDAKRETQTSICEERYSVTAIHQKIIHELILGREYGEKAWKIYIEEQSTQSQDLKTGIDKFKQMFKFDPEGETVPDTINLTKAKGGWEEFKKNLSTLKGEKE